MKSLLLFCLFVCSCIGFKTLAQNQHEPQTWEKLHSPFVNVLYKKGQLKEAQQIANTISYIQKNNNSSIGYHYHPIDIVLRSKTVESNGFVTYSPFRSEFFNTSPSVFNNLGTTNWLSTLAIHEYRHVQQFLNHKSGFTNVLYYLLGESGWGLGSALTIPDWYFEGDAVVMETALTKSGRGRVPKFSALQRSIAQQNISYTYQKVRNGSYKSLLPSQYQNGYQMLNYYRNNFDASRLKNIAQNAASYSFPFFYGFSYQLKKETGLSTKKLYKKTNQYNALKWQKKRDSLSSKTYTPVSKSSSKKVTFYQYPQLLKDQKTIVALKSSFHQLPTFYKIKPDGTETKIKTAIQNVDAYFQHKNNQLLYTGFSQHPRYNYSSYNDIFCYDLNTNQQKRITKKQKYFSPSFNADATKIIAIENIEGHCSLIILAAKSGSLISKIPLQGFISRPLFVDDTHFIFLQQKEHQLAIVKCDMDGNTSLITNYTSHTIDNISINNNNVYYSASFNGIDNIYQTPLDGSLAIEQITNAKIGAYQPFVSNHKVYFTQPTAFGNKISSEPINSNPFTFKEPLLMNWDHQKTIEFEKGTILDKISNKKYRTTKHTSIFEDLKFHDWNYGLTDEQISGSVTATNLLNDFSLIAATHIYLQENGSFKLAALASYKKWFPIFNTAIEFTHRNFNSFITNNEGADFEGNKVFNDIAIHPSINIPLSQNLGNYRSALNLEVGYEYHTISNHSFQLKEIDQTIKLNNPNYSLYNAKASLSHKKRTARQHINSHLGFSSFVNLNQHISGVYNGYFFNTQNRLFLPGLSFNHNSYITFNHQINKVSNRFTYVNLNADTFDYARGFKSLNNVQKATKLSFTYQLPLLYPDTGIAGITYFKRIRANLFADFSSVTFLEFSDDLSNSFQLKNTNQNSLGFEILFDNTFFNIGQAEISIGIRGSFLLSNDVQNPSQNFVSGLVLSSTLF